LKTTLLEPDQRAMANAPTKNTEAHNAYLLGHYYFERARSRGLPPSDRLF